MKRFAILVLMIGLVSGCASEIPIPTAYERSYQPKMWAAHHWNVLAADVAERLAVATGELAPGQPMVLHVRPARPGTVFNTGFHELLETQLIQQGFGVTRNPLEADLEVEVGVTYAGRADHEVDSGYTRVVPQDRDVLVNISVLRGDRYLTRISEIFYIDETIGHEFVYQPPQQLPPTRLIEVVGN